MRGGQGGVWRRPRAALAAASPSPRAPARTRDEVQLVLRLKGVAQGHNVGVVQARHDRLFTLRVHQLALRG
jgi:hypothetical protein